MTSSAFQVIADLFAKSKSVPVTMVTSVTALKSKAFPCHQSETPSGDNGDTRGERHHCHQTDKTPGDRENINQFNDVTSVTAVTNENNDPKIDFGFSVCRLCSRTFAQGEPHMRHDLRPWPATMYPPGIAAWVHPACFEQRFGSPQTDADDRHG